MGGRNWLEWLVLGVSVLAVVGIVGFLLADGLTDQGRPPRPEVELHRDRAYDSPAGWLLPATVSNDGDEAAQALNLVATASVRGQPEEAEASVDYLPAGTTVEVTFGFSAEPDGDVAVRVVGFVP